jgi:hypothetical protein
MSCFFPWFISGIDHFRLILCMQSEVDVAFAL